MNLKSIILSSSGLKNINLNSININNKFEFRFGEKILQMNNLFAEFISPIVSKIHYSDQTIDYIYLNDFLKCNSLDFQLNPEEIFSDDIISLLQQLSRGYSISINIEQSIKLRFISIILQNDELYEKINESFPTEINESNIDLYLHNLKLLYDCSKISKDFSFSDIIDFVASRFYSIDQKELKKLPKSILYSIISSDHLTLESEDSLLDFIHQIFDNHDGENLKITEFYEKVEFCELTQNKFNEFLNSFDINQMTNELWRKFKEIISPYNKGNDQNRRYYSNGKLFEYDGNMTNCFNGIIRYLTKKCHGNVDEKNVVKVTSSTVYYNRYSKYVVDLDDDKHYFTSDCQQNSWIKFDFKDKKVRPTHYTLRTKSDSGKGGNHLKNWVVEGSNTDWGDEWKILDARSDVTFLDSANAKYVFDIQNELGKDDYYRYLRIRQTGKNSYGAYFLNLSALEYFGYLK